MSRIASSLLVASLVVLAGCAGAIGGPGGTQASDSGTVAFYVSDEQNAIEQFSHLNVTVTEVAFAGVENASVGANATANASATASGNASTNGTSGAAGTASADADAEASAEAEAGLVTRDVEDRTVDLTTLQGANATLLGNVSVPAGEYEKVFVHVSEVNATLQNGESVNVKLPSQKLHVKKGFATNASGSVDFVFDITVVEAGKSGKYILKPVASESGTDVEIEAVGAAGAAANAELDVSVLGNASAGENATVKVTHQGDAVANAKLLADDEVVATTNANGTAQVHVPADGELELEATANASASGNAGENGDGAVLDGELEVEIGAGAAAGGESDDADNGGDASGNASADLAVAIEGSLATEKHATILVTDGDGDPVENATVTVDGTVVGETNAGGELTLDGTADVSLDSELVVTADGERVTLSAGTVAAAN
ncbi:DUF4382 domain-containing protein [Halobacterium zhouii]|uniref:DUF4382 domain-containing protein n=1 Tax=Halobacterium zhouii TaxID=2902624 RepID=UPI001E65032B|nr:DUF4382 domain-containing protein [Halobacterium zhouii]